MGENGWKHGASLVQYGKKAAAALGRGAGCI